MINGKVYSPRVVGNAPEISPEVVHEKIAQNVFKDFNQPFDHHYMNNGGIKGENSPSPNRDPSVNIVRRVEQKPKVNPPRKIKTKRLLGDSGNFKQLPPGEVYRGKTKQLSLIRKRKDKDYYCPQNEDTKNIKKRKKKIRI